MTAQVQQLIDAPVEEVSASDAAIEPAPDASEPAEAPAARPAGVPEKFWDREAGSIRTDALLKSYVELERKLGSMVPLPGDDDQEGRERLWRVLGVPDAAEEYQIEAPRRTAPADRRNQCQAASGRVHPGAGAAGL